MKILRIVHAQHSPMYRLKKRHNAYAFWKDTKMATFADTHAPAGFSIRFAEALRTLADRIVSKHQYRVTVRELSNLTSRELADLGINRASIHQIALDCAFGRKA